MPPRIAGPRRRLLAVACLPVCGGEAPGPVPLGAGRHPIPLLPTSARFPAGHRIRLSLAGADADTFAPITPDGATFTVERGPDASTLELPVDAGP